MFFQGTGFVSYFISKNDLYKQNETLRNEIGEIKAERVNYEVVINENMILNEKLGILDNKSIVVANVIQRPGFSPYDFLVIDKGTLGGIVLGNNVFFGNFDIGEVIEVYEKTAKVELYSSRLKVINVLVGESKLPLNATGLGGGAFEVLLPKGKTLKEGENVVLAEEPLKIFGVISSISQNETDDFKKARFSLPLNVYELSNVSVSI